MTQGADENESPDSGLTPAKVIRAAGAVHGPASRLWQGIPGLERAANGRLWAAWYTGGDGEGPGNHVVLATSGDDGATWIDPALLIVPGPCQRTFDACLWLDPENRLWLFWTQSGENALFDGRGGVWAIRADRPEREDALWTKPVRLCHGVMMNKPTVLANGDWLLPAAVWTNSDPAPKPDAYPHRGSGVVASSDGGLSWRWRGALAFAPGRAVDEHMLVERRDGSLWMLFRAVYGIGQSVSRDGGRTWSRARPTEIDHVNARFFIRRLRSGALLLVHHQLPADYQLPADHLSFPRTHLTARISDDDGRTWKGGLLLDERDRVSYPDGCQAPDGSIRIIYDYNRGIKGSPPDRMDREILMAAFREEDVRAGGASAADVRFRQLVSKATASPDITSPPCARSL